MTDTSPRIVFMGTPEFATASLRALTEQGYNVAAAVTSTDKPSGRGRKITFSPVKEYAIEKGIRCMQPEKLRDPSFIAELREIDADIFVVVAFRMLPEEVWSLPRLGTFNLHASLLPQYRGAAPINHAIMNGETKTGVTTFLIDREIDTGKILLSKETAIEPSDDAGKLHDKLMIMGAGLVIETVKGLWAGTLASVPQTILPGQTLHAAPKIFPPDTVIDWCDTSAKIINKIRGLSPYPCATTTFKSDRESIRFKIFSAATAENVPLEPGEIITNNSKKLIIGAGHSAVEITSLQAEGRKRMSAEDFMHGTDLTGWKAS